MAPRPQQQQGVWVDSILSPATPLKKVIIPFLGLYQLRQKCGWNTYWYYGADFKDNHINHSQVKLITTDNTKYTLSIKEQLLTTISNFNQTFIGDVVANNTLTTYYPYDTFINKFYWMGGIIRVKAENGGCNGENRQKHISGFQWIWKLFYSRSNNNKPYF